MRIATCNHNIGFLIMVLQELDFDPLINGNPFAPPIDPIPAPGNATGTDTQITEVVRLYKYNKKNSPPTMNTTLF